MQRMPSAGAWVAGLAIIGLASCGQPASQTDGEPDSAANESAFESPLVPAPQPPMDRAGLLAAVARAASAKASGTDDSDAQRRLDGRQFEVRIRFGCRGPAADLPNSWLGWALDTEHRKLNIQARPTITLSEPLLRRLKADEFESVEGFWIPRPWMLEASCPAAVQTSSAENDAGGEGSESDPTESPANPAIEDPVPLGPRVGIAQFFSEDDARTGRRKDRPYKAVQNLMEGPPMPSRGFTLVLSGRLRSQPTMGVIGCVAQGPDSPPECIVSAEFDKVWIESPDTQEIVAQWTSG